MIQKLEIEEFLKLAEVHPVLDARSPGEFTQAHIPKAFSFPLFTDDERKIVGTAYKQKSREDAIKIGLDMFGWKMRVMVENVESIIASSDHPNSKTVLIHCWRGGMRSAAIAWLLDLYGFKVYTLKGGYKAFRNWVLEQFHKEYSFSILGGYTGSGKTPLLDQLEQSDALVIDLEKIACHKGSAFGALGEDAQPRQEMFENKIAVELFFKAHSGKTIWLEDESQRVGQMLIPKGIWEQMRKSRLYFLDIPFEKRVEYLVSTYGTYNKEGLVNATMRIQKRLGGLETKNVINSILENDFKTAFTILLKYYDKLYFKGLNNRTNLENLLIKIPCDSVTIENYKKLINLIN